MRIVARGYARLCGPFLAVRVQGACGGETMAQTEDVVDKIEAYAWVSIVLSRTYRVYLQRGCVDQASFGLLPRCLSSEACQTLTVHASVVYALTTASFVHLYTGNPTAAFLGRSLSTPPTGPAATAYCKSRHVHSSWLRDTSPLSRQGLRRSRYIVQRPHCLLKTTQECSVLWMA